MTIPVYVLTGFLGSGKTTLIGEMIRPKLAHSQILLLQFEEGEEELDPEIEQNGYFDKLVWSKKDLEQNEESIVCSLEKQLDTREYDEIWVEWNGMEKFGRLERILLQSRILDWLHIEKVI